eukprot:6720764-Prymnesium_polylepis.1
MGRRGGAVLGGRVDAQGAPLVQVQARAPPNASSRCGCGRAREQSGGARAHSKKSDVLSCTSTARRSPPRRRAAPPPRPRQEPAGRGALRAEHVDAAAVVPHQRQLHDDQAGA